MLFDFLDLPTSTYLLLCGVAFVAGFIDAIAGGGGLLTIPALLSAGLPPHLALGTNKLAASFGSCTAAFAYYKKRLFDPVFWRWSFVATAIGAISGTLFIGSVSTDWLDKILPVVVLSAAVYTIVNRAKVSEGNDLPAKGPELKRKQWLQGLSLGFYDGAAGPGTGAFWTVSGMALYKFNILLASGVAKAMNFTSNFLSLLTFIILGHIDWVLGLSMGVCIMLGSYIGAHSAIRFGARFIRPIFISMVILIALNLAYDAWF